MYSQVISHTYAYTLENPSVQISEEYCHPMHLKLPNIKTQRNCAIRVSIDSILQLRRCKLSWVAIFRTAGTSHPYKLLFLHLVSCSIIVAMCLFFFSCHFKHYFIGKAKRIYGKLWWMEYQVKYKNWDKDFEFNTTTY